MEGHQTFPSHFFTARAIILIFKYRIKHSMARLEMSFNLLQDVYKRRNMVFRKGLHFDESYGRNHSAGSRHCSGHLLEKDGSYENH